MLYRSCFFDQDKAVANVPLKDIKEAVKKYFGRLHGDVTRLDYNNITLEARIMKDSVVIQVKIASPKPKECWKSQQSGYCSS